MIGVVVRYDIISIGGYTMTRCDIYNITRVYDLVVPLRLAPFVQQQHNNGSTTAVHTRRSVSYIVIHRGYEPFCSQRPLKMNGWCTTNNKLQQQRKGAQ